MVTDNASTAFKVYIVPAQVGLRLDQCPFSPLSRSRLKALILQGQVTVDGVTVRDPATQMRSEQIVEVIVPPLISVQLEPQALSLVFVYEDADLVVIDKPAGMVVHPAPGSPDATVVNALLAHCGACLSSVGGIKRPGIVHRLDKNTTGLLVVAKTDLAYHSLAAQFASHHVERAYKAVAWGVPHPLSGMITGNIGRHPIDRKKMAVVRSGGKLALTHYQVTQIFGQIASLVECRLATGRTHQIRVHMTSIGHPLIGDQVYGRTRTRSIRERMIILRAFSRQALHAYLIGFYHPRTGSQLHFESALPFDIKHLINFLETH